MFITFSDSDKKEWLPNEYRDWHETESYIAMYNGDITKWIEEKVDKMLCEIKIEGYPFVIIFGENFIICSM